MRAGEFRHQSSMEGVATGLKRSGPMGLANYRDWVLEGFFQMTGAATEGKHKPVACSTGIEDFSSPSRTCLKPEKPSSFRTSSTLRDGRSAEDLKSALRSPVCSLWRPQSPNGAAFTASSRGLPSQGAKSTPIADLPSAAALALAHGPGVDRRSDRRPGSGQRLPSTAIEGLWFYRLNCPGCGSAPIEACRKSDSRDPPGRQRNGGGAGLRYVFSVLSILPSLPSSLVERKSC